MTFFENVYTIKIYREIDQKIILEAKLNYQVQENSSLWTQIRKLKEVFISIMSALSSSKPVMQTPQKSSEKDFNSQSEEIAS